MPQEMDVFQKIEDVNVGLHFMNKEEQRKYFDADLGQYDSAPIYISIENDSDKNYSFSRDSINIKGAADVKGLSKK